jgi:hypothetical protein
MKASVEMQPPITDHVNIDVSDGEKVCSGKNEENPEL